MLKWLQKSIWSFPLIILLLFTLLVVLKIHGSSIGVYHKLTYAKKTADSSLLFGAPKDIRSDEWKTTTPFIFLQAQSNFPSFNEKLGTGRDVSINPHLPMKDWVTIFRPNTYSYFVLPFDYAFVLSWWFGLVALILTSYFFCLRVLNNKKTLSILLSLSFSLSPFIFWWYRIDLFIPLAFGFLILIVGMRVIKQEKIPWVKSLFFTNFLYACLLAYIGTVIALQLYLPFLLPILIGVVVFLIGFSIDELRKIKNKYPRLKTVLLTGFVSLMIAGTFCVLFLLDRADVVNAINGSVYPGDREIKSGELTYNSTYLFLGSFLLPLLQFGGGDSYYANQSEASNFILLGPLLVIPGFVLLIYGYKKYHKVNFTFLLLQILLIFFMIRVSFPIGDLFYKLFLLDKVPNNRLVAGIGFIAFIQLVYFLKLFIEFKVKVSKKLTYLTLAWAVAVFISTLLFLKFFISNKYTDFINYGPPELLLASLFSLTIYFIVRGHKITGAGLLLGITLISSYNILPLYKGADFLKTSSIIESIKSTSDPEEKWVVLDSLNFESLPFIAGRGSVNGPQMYTDLSFWQEFDEDKTHEYIYNRQGHALFITNTTEVKSESQYNLSTTLENFELVKGNVFKVKFTCSNFTYKHIDYALTTHELDISCLDFVKKVTYPKTTFYIYKLKK